MYLEAVAAIFTGVTTLVAEPIALQGSNLGSMIDESFLSQPAPRVHKELVRMLAAQAADSLIDR